MTRDGSEGSGGGSRGQSGSRHENGSRHDSVAVSGAPGADSIFSPAGLKVLVVDDDLMCLKVVSAMLQRCSYEVTTCSNGNDALSLLRERNEDGAADQFDLVLSDVYMPDMDGFKLLEHIGLELDLPVIMMSSNGDTNVVLRGVTHGAVDFLIKPVRIEELRNVWQHVVRRRSMALVRTPEDGGASDEDSLRHGVKRKESEHSQAQPSSEQGGSKKPRVVWSVEMHQQFVNAVNTLGIDKAVPKRILDLMNVEGLTRENVASHLQKYRLYLKRVEGVQGGGGGKHPKSIGSSRVHPEALAAAGAVAAAAVPAAAAALGTAQQQQATPTAAMQLKQQPMQHPMGPVGMPGIAQGLPPGMLGMGPPPALQLHQAMAMQAAAAAAAASGALPGSMPPFMPPGLHPGMMHPPGMPGLGGMMGQPPPGMMPPGMDMGHLSGFGGGMMFPPPPQPPASMPQQLAAMAPPPPVPPASAGLPSAGLEAALQCAAGGAAAAAAAAQRDACDVMGHCGPMGGPSGPSAGQPNGLLGEMAQNMGEPGMLQPPPQEAQLCFGGFTPGGEDPLGHNLGDLPFLNDLPPSAKEPDDFLDLFLKENGMNEEL